MVPAPLRWVHSWFQAFLLCWLPIFINADDSTAVDIELESFQVADEFSVNLFASEAHGVINPLTMRWDPRGRLFVACSLVYPQLKPGGIPNDKIIVLEDTNGDGRADQSAVFADGLNIPTGMEISGEGVYIGQGTQLLHLEDTDGDGRADRQSVVLSGFGNGDSHQTSNSFVWSPGGELYFCQGDGIESRVETPWGISRLYQAGVWRFRPERLQIGGLLDDFMGPGNPWGVAFDDWGQAVVVDGAGGIAFLTPAMIATSHRLRLPRIGDPGGYCGVEVIGGRPFPQDFQGDFLLGDYKPNRVSRFALEEKGAGFEVVWKDPLLRSSHRNFRPVDVRIGPDGIYVADWYNPVICHQDDFFRHPDRDKTHGRIWRIVWDGRPQLPRPALADTPTPFLLDSLKSPDRWVRYQTKRVLANRDRHQVASALRHWIETLDPKDTRYERDLFQALSTFETIEIVEPKILNRLLSAQDHRARAYATRVIGRWHDRLANPLDLLEPRTQDTHPLVRMEAAIACGNIPSARSIDVAAMVIDKPTDRWIDYAFTQAVRHLKPHWLPTFRTGALSFDGHPRRLAAVLDKAQAPELLDDLKRLARSEQLDANLRATMMKGLVHLGGPDEWQQTLSPYGYIQDSNYAAAIHVDVLRDVIQVSQRTKARPSGDLERSLRWMVDHDDQELRACALELAGIWKVHELKEDLLNAARTTGGSIEIRQAALSSLGRIGDETCRSTLMKISRSDEAADIRARAISALCAIDIKSAAAQAADLLTTAKHVDPKDLFPAFLSKKDGVSHLATAIEGIDLDSTTAETYLQALLSLGCADVTLISLLAQSVGLSGEVPEFSPQVVDALAHESATNGDPARGKAVFHSAIASCNTCHAVRGEGGWIGPDLTAIGRALSAERIIEEVLWPSRHVKEGYTLVQLETNDGDFVQGYERSVDRDELQIQDLVTGKLRRIPRDQIDSRNKGGTAMPDGLTAALTPSQLSDLIRYVSELGTEDQSE